MTFDMSSRDVPEPFIRLALDEFKKRGGKTIVELGCMRQPMVHKPLECTDTCLSRCDGHSTAIFDAVEGAEFHSVDISQKSCDIARAHLKHTPHENIFCMDAIAFLKECLFEIDLLYLDAWDVDLPDSAEKHLEAYLAAQHCIHDNTIILIDDTDVYWDGIEFHPVFSDHGGKGRLVIPHMIEDGWEVKFKGRQTMLVKINK